MEPIEIGFTQFIDFSLKNSISRVGFIRTLKNQPPYNPAIDFWRKLRNKIKEIHEQGLEVSELDELLNEISSSKQNQYSQAINQYKKFCRNKQIQYFEVARSIWTLDRLTVRSTPEMGLIINGKPYLIKMYFKEHKERLDKRRVDALLALMQTSLSETPYPRAKNAVLNVKKGTMYTLDKQVTDSMKLALENDAFSFMRLWDSV